MSQRGSPKKQQQQPQQQQQQREVGEGVLPPPPQEGKGKGKSKSKGKGKKSKGGKQEGKEEEAKEEKQALPIVSTLTFTNIGENRTPSLSTAPRRACTVVFVTETEAGAQQQQQQQQRRQQRQSKSSCVVEGQVAVVTFCGTELVTGFFRASSNRVERKSAPLRFLIKAHTRQAPEEDCLFRDYVVTVPMNSRQYEAVFICEAADLDLEATTFKVEISVGEQAQADARSGFPVTQRGFTLSPEQLVRWRGNGGAPATVRGLTNPAGTNKCPVNSLQATLFSPVAVETAFLFPATSSLANNRLPPLTRARVLTDQMKAMGVPIPESVSRDLVVEKEGLLVPGRQEDVLEYLQLTNQKLKETNCGAVATALSTVYTMAYLSTRDGELLGPLQPVPVAEPSPCVLVDTDVRSPNLDKSDSKSWQSIPARWGASAAAAQPGGWDHQGRHQVNAPISLPPQLVVGVKTHGRLPGGGFAKGKFDAAASLTLNTDEIFSEHIRAQLKGGGIYDLDAAAFHTGVYSAKGGRGHWRCFRRVFKFDANGEPMDETWILIDDDKAELTSRDVALKQMGEEAILLVYTRRDFRLYFQQKYSDPAIERAKEVYRNFPRHRLDRVVEIPAVFGRLLPRAYFEHLKAIVITDKAMKDPRRTRVKFLFSEDLTWDRRLLCLSPGELSGPDVVDADWREGEEGVLKEGEGRVLPTAKLRDILAILATHAGLSPAEALDARILPIKEDVTGKILTVDAPLDQLNDALTGHHLTAFFIYVSPRNLLEYSVAAAGLNGSIAAHPECGTPPFPPEVKIPAPLQDVRISRWEPEEQSKRLLCLVRLPGVVNARSLHHLVRCIAWEDEHGVKQSAAPMQDDPVLKVQATVSAARATLVRAEAKRGQEGKGAGAGGAPRMDADEVARARAVVTVAEGRADELGLAIADLPPARQAIALRAAAPVAMHMDGLQPRDPVPPVGPESKDIVITTPLEPGHFEVPPLVLGPRKEGRQQQQYMSNSPPLRDFVPADSITLWCEHVDDRGNYHVVPITGAEGDFVIPYGADLVISPRLSSPAAVEQARARFQANRRRIGLPSGVFVEDYGGLAAVIREGVTWVEIRPAGPPGQAPVRLPVPKGSNLGFVREQLAQHLDAQVFLFPHKTFQACSLSFSHGGEVWGRPLSAVTEVSGETVRLSYVALTAEAKEALLSDVDDNTAVFIVQLDDNRGSRLYSGIFVNDRTHAGRVLSIRPIQKLLLRAFGTAVFKDATEDGKASQKDKEATAASEPPGKGEGDSWGQLPQGPHAEGPARKKQRRDSPRPGGALAGTAAGAIRNRPQLKFAIKYDKVTLDRTNILRRDLQDSTGPVELTLSTEGNGRWASVQRGMADREPLHTRWIADGKQDDGTREATERYFNRIAAISGIPEERRRECRLYRRDPATGALHLAWDPENKLNNADTRTSGGNQFVLVCPSLVKAGRDERVRFFDARKPPARSGAGGKGAGASATGGAGA